MDVKNVLVFATDEETVKIAKGSGFTTFYDEKVRLDVTQSVLCIPRRSQFSDMVTLYFVAQKLFGHLPTKAAGCFGDEHFHGDDGGKNRASALGESAWIRSPLPGCRHCLVQEPAHTLS